MRTGSHIGSAIAAATIVLGLGAAPLAAAPDPDLERFKTEVEALVAGLGPSTNGVLEWRGGDPFEIRRDGDNLVAVFANAKLLLHADETVQLGFDRLEVRQTGRPGGENSVELAILLPKEVGLDGPDGPGAQLTIKDGRATAVVDPRSGRARDLALSFAAAHIDHPGTGGSIDFGPLTTTSKLVAEAGGGWSAPFDFELQKIAISVPQLGAASIERIAAAGTSTGPDLAALEKLRDRLDAMQKEKEAPPDARLARLLAILPEMPSVFAAIRGAVTLDLIEVRDAAGASLVRLAQAEVKAEATGFDRDKAAMRFTVREDGLDVAPTLLDPRQVPRRMVVDFGVEDLKTDAVRALLRAAGEAESGERQGGEGLLAAAARLDPTFRIYDVAVDAREVGADLTGEARGSPLAPGGYVAGGDLSVRGFEAIPDLRLDALTAYLPLLKELAVEDKAPDGSPRISYRLASSPARWATVNDNDVSLWFDSPEPTPGRPRLLKPAEPPIEGADVKSVQRALAAAKIAVEEDGVYRPATAAAVARFQKRHGINVSGVVDDETRRLLGIDTPAPPRRGGQN
jgi:hypothetical protein